MGNFEDLTKQESFLSEEIKHKEEKNSNRISDYKSLKESIESWRFKNSFKRIEKEMGDFIANGNPDEISLLQKEADRLHAQISALDNDLNTIRGLYLKLKEKPDRHKCLEVTKATEALLNASELVTLRDLDSFRCNNLHNIKKQIDDVLRSFEIEAEKVAKNKKTASQLLKKIKKYESYENLFNLKQHLNDSEKLATRVIQSPNFDNPNDDELELQTAKSKLNQCIEKVEREMAEQERIEQIKREKEEREQLAREKRQDDIKAVIIFICIAAAVCFGIWLLYKLAIIVIAFIVSNWWWILAIVLLILYICLRPIND